jgi:tripartite ATP-independent transporter DctM subunit
MDWLAILLSVFGSLLLLLATGFPVVLAFILITFSSLYVLQGGNGAALQQNILAMETSLQSFTLLPVPLFILMGELLWQSNIASNALGAIDKWLGRVPGRLSLLTVLSGTVFSALSGSTMANTAILGKLLLPDMHRRGYHPTMSMGPIMGSGALAMLIPPSALAVVYATIAQISIGALLMALILPGLLLAASYVAYIVIRCYFNPKLAPPDENLVQVDRKQALRELLIYVAPLSLIVFCVIGVIFLGVATPTESAALGALSSLVLAAAYRGLTWKGFASAIEGTVQISAMVLIIIAAAIGFSQLLAFSGASKGLLDYVVALSAEPTTVILLLMLLILILGCFMEQIAIMSVTLPIFAPLLKLLGIEPIWFAVMMLINLEIGLMHPPFGLLLFVMKGVAPPEVRMTTIYLAAVPYLVINLLMIALILLVPKTALFLPSLLH